MSDDVVRWHASLLQQYLDSSVALRDESIEFLLLNPVAVQDGGDEHVDRLTAIDKELAEARAKAVGSGGVRMRSSWPDLIEGDTSRVVLFGSIDHVFVRDLIQRLPARDDLRLVLDLPSKSCLEHRYSPALAEDLLTQRDACAKQGLDARVHGTKKDIEVRRVPIYGVPHVYTASAEGPQRALIWPREFENTYSALEADVPCSLLALGADYPYRKVLNDADERAEPFQPLRIVATPDAALPEDPHFSPYLFASFEPESEPAESGNGIPIAVGALRAFWRENGRARNGVVLQRRARENARDGYGRWSLLSADVEVGHVLQSASSTTPSGDQREAFVDALTRLDPHMRLPVEAFRVALATAYYAFFQIQPEDLHRIGLRNPIVVLRQDVPADPTYRWSLYPRLPLLFAAHTTTEAIQRAQADAPDENFELMPLEAVRRLEPDDCNALLAHLIRTAQLEELFYA